MLFQLDNKFRSDLVLCTILAFFVSLNAEYNKWYGFRMISKAENGFWASDILAHIFSLVRYMQTKC